MAKLLIRTIEGENIERYMRGDIVAVLPDTHVFGRMESMEVWIAEGRNPALWPGGFLIVELTGLSESVAQAYLVRTAQRRRDFAVDIAAIVAALPAGKLATYNAVSRITLSWSNPDVRAAIKAKL